MISFPMYRDLAERQQVLTGIVATAGETSIRVTVPSASRSAREIDNARISFVSGNYFSVLGVGPAAGRVFSPDDDRDSRTAPRTAGSVVVLSDGFWDRQFGRDPAVVGRTVLIGRARAARDRDHAARVRRRGHRQRRRRLDAADGVVVARRSRQSPRHLHRLLRASRRRA